MDKTDEVLCQLKGKLNRNKTRMIDVFRVIDESGDGSVSAEEFRIGVGRLGFKMSDEDFKAVAQGLDKDCSGDVSIKEFEKALKLAVKKAQQQGRAHELDTFEASLKSRGLSEMSETKFDWSQRRLRTDAGCFPTATTSLWSQQSSWSPQSAGSSWVVSSLGPSSTAYSSKIGSGSLMDNTVRRHRVLDAGHISSPPSLKGMTIPIHKTPDRDKVHRGRFGAHPAAAPSNSHGKRDRILFAERSTLQGRFDAGVRKYGNAPMMQSTVDQVVFNHDMDFSGEDKFDEDFTAMFEDCRGLPSWHRGR